MPMEAEVAETFGGSSSSTAPEVIAFDTFDEDLTPVDHKFVDRPSPTPKVLMRAVKREMLVLRKGLLDGEEGVVAPIMVRTYASRSDLFRAMVVGPPGTPYAHVPFFFDLAMSAQYPAEPPLVHYLSQFASSSERLNPNLYCDGKVCLSLLGTWAGPGWDPNHSTLLQVLVSLQGLVLVEDPYFNEPGHESDAKSEHGRTASALYNESVRLLCLRAALNIHQQPPRGFEEVVAKHFSVYGPQILAQCEEALQGQGSEGFRQVLGKSILPKMRAEQLTAYVGTHQELFNRFQAAVEQLDSEKDLCKKVASERDSLIRARDEIADALNKERERAEKDRQEAEQVRQELQNSCRKGASQC
eukprot:symbB.v1.2.012600.t1/scaffold820.1/size171332/7